MEAHNMKREHLKNCRKWTKSKDMFIRTILMLAIVQYFGITWDESAKCFVRWDEDTGGYPRSPGSPTSHVIAGIGNGKANGQVLKTNA
jgi:hypothetical protein